jgi:hypothetical protein
VNRIVKYFVALWGLFALIAIIFSLYRSANLILIAGLGALTTGVVIVAVKEKLRKKKEGFYIYKRGGAESGVLFYDERGRILQLYFSRITDTIYIPSDLKWKEIMPGWAKERKDEIVSRIKKRIGKRLIGKSWTYAQSDLEEHLIYQKESGPTGGRLR